MARKNPIFMSDEQAQRITKEYNISERYLRSLVSSLIRDGAYNLRTTANKYGQLAFNFDW